MLIFDNNQHYEYLMENGFEKYPNKRDLVILCKKWLESGINFDDLKENMVNFCSKWNSQFNYIKSESLILSVLDALKQENSEFAFNNNIELYKNEINTIKSIENDKLQRLFYVMLVLAKWRNADFVYINSSSSIKLSDIFDLAEIKCTKKEQLAMLHELNNAGVCDIQLKPLCKFFFRCGEKIDEKRLSIELGVDNLVQKWKEYDMCKCACCGKAFIKNNNKQKYCKDCAKLVKNKQNKSYLDKKGK